MTGPAEGVGVCDEADLVGLTRPINNPLAFLSSKLSSVNGVEEPGGNHVVPSKWNSKSSLLGDYTCCDLVVKLKECKRREGPSTPEPAPAPPEPAAPQEPETPDLPEDCSKGWQMPAGSLTLQVRTSVLPGLIPAEGRSSPGSPWAHDLTSASEDGDLSPLRSVCVTLGRSPIFSESLSHCVSDGENVVCSTGLE